MATFGKTDVGGTIVTKSVDIHYCICRWTAPADGNVTSMSVYIDDALSATQFRLGLYNMINCSHTTNARPGTVAGQSAATAIGAGWQSAAVAAAITNGSIYGMVVGADNDIDIVYDADADTRKTYTNTNYTWGAFPNTPSGSGHSHEARAYSIYATYTAVGGVSVPVIMHHYGHHISKIIRG